MSKNNPEDFRDKLVIDEHGLEEALREHPELVYDVGIALAEAISVRDAAKQDLELVEAEVDKAIRHAAYTSDDKITEKEVESEKRRSKKVIAATSDFLDKKLVAAEWTALEHAFEKRSYALSKLVDLYLARYYSDIDKTGSDNFKTLQSVRAKKDLLRQRRESS